LVGTPAARRWPPIFFSAPEFFSEKRRGGPFSLASDGQPAQWVSGLAAALI
jgi:hypothetical protein